MKKTICVLCSMLFVFFVFAKEKPSLIFELGATGYDKSYVDTQKISIDGEAISLSVPYARTVFNPDICLGISVPICDIKDNLFFVIAICYDLLLDSSLQDFPSSWIRADTYTHLGSALPSFYLKKGDAQFFIGTGLRFGISIYDFQQDYTTSYKGTEYLLYQLFWIAEAGAKYRITNHLSIMGTIGISVAFYSSIEIRNSYTYSRGNTTTEDETSSYVGEYPLYFSPKLGICYTF